MLFHVRLPEITVSIIVTVHRGQFLIACEMGYAQVEPKSFLSLDTEGRVIRLDSFSKVISSGLRLGFITAAAPLIASIELHLQSSHLHAPTLSQVGRVAFLPHKAFQHSPPLVQLAKLRL